MQVADVEAKRKKAVEEVTWGRGVNVTASAPFLPPPGTPQVRLGCVERDERGREKERESERESGSAREIFVPKLGCPWEGMITDTPSTELE